MLDKTEYKMSESQTFLTKITNFHLSQRNVFYKLLNKSCITSGSLNLHFIRMFIVGPICSYMYSCLLPIYVRTAPEQ